MFMLICSLLVSSAVAVDFIKIANGGLPASNHAGVYYLDHEAKTQQACQDLCEYDMLCKSFDYGASGATRGHCYLSYDSRATLGANLISNSDFDYYEKKETKSAVPNFGVTENAYIIGSNDGGEFDIGSHSLESCAARCMKDAACKSFDYGKLSYDGRCLLSYEAVGDPGVTLQTLPRGYGTVGWLFRFSYDHYQKKQPSELGTRCASGSVSISGYYSSSAADCVTCPVNTFSALAQTFCEVCPADYTSPANSGSIESCVSTVPYDSNAIVSVGMRYVGLYSCPAFFLSEDGHFQFEIVKLTAANGKYNVLALVELDGEVTNNVYYASGTLDDLTSLDSLTLTPQQNSRQTPSLQGSFLKDSDTGTVSFNGRLRGGRCNNGQFDSHRTCHLPIDVPVFELGDQWVGTFTCTRDKSRADMIVTEVRLACALPRAPVMTLSA